MGKEKESDSQEKLDWKDYLALIVAFLQTVLVRFVLLIVAVILVGLALILIFSR